MAIILGIDPGSLKTGYGIINQVGAKAQYIASGVVRLQQLPNLAERLDTIFCCISEIIELHLPQEMAIEEVFMGKNAQSALKLGHARGAAMIAATQNQLPVYEYAARKVKQSVVGHGNADKASVGYMVKQLLSLPSVPQEDAADALAIALCHGHSRQQLIQSASPRLGKRGRMQLSSIQSRKIV